MEKFKGRVLTKALYVHCSLGSNNVIILVTCFAFQGPNATCTTPENLAGKRILDVLSTSTKVVPPVTSSTVPTTKTTSTSTTVTASRKTFITIQSSPRQGLTTVSSHNVSIRGDYGCLFLYFCHTPSILIHQLAYVCQILAFTYTCVIY